MQKLIDLTHSLSPEVPTWDGSPGFGIEINTDYADCTPPDIFRTQKINMGAGIGTHMDAPAHVVPGARTIDALGLDDLTGDCAVIDVSAEAGEDYVISPAAVEKFEREHGQIRPHTFVIFYTGWSRRWAEREKYNNNHKFPAVAAETAELLIQRGIMGLGTDTLSADTGAKGFPVHRAILGADKILVENIANADQLPPTGAKVFILPPKIAGGTEAPVRMIGII
jgi:kynurenine formamidase